MRPSTLLVVCLALRSLTQSGRFVPKTAGQLARIARRRSSQLYGPRERILRGQVSEQGRYSRFGEFALA